MRFMQLEREGSPPPGLRLAQAKLSRKSNQVARGRIRRFESYMPSPWAFARPRGICPDAPSADQRCDLGSALGRSLRGVYCDGHRDMGPPDIAEASLAGRPIFPPCPR